MAGDTSKKRIFVQMVSYRDPECHPTLRDMFEKASHPERITVGLCWQYDPDEDMECFAEEYPRADQVKVLQYHIRDAQGAGWARQEAQSLWAGEEYTMQVQAHMRFEPGWDETLIHMYEGIPAKKKVLTGWPPRYTPPNEKVETPGLFPITGVNMLGRENDAQIVHLLRRLIPIADVPANPMITATWVGCFLFAESDVFKKVPFDPHIYFWGEEINYSARLWTHGYDMYHMNKVVLYHYWSRHEGAKGAVDYRDHQNKLNRLSLMRNRHVLGLGSAPEAEALVNIEKYSLGTERTLADYLRFYGIDLIQRTVLPFAKMGYWHDTGKVNQRKPGEAPRIFVAVASYRDPELSPTLADMFAKATDNSRLRVGICLQHDPDTDKNCGIVCDYPKQCRVMEMHYRNSQGANWARAQAMSMRKDEDYVLMIDSHMRFEPGWDNTLIDMLSRCPAEKPVLSAYLSNYTPPDDRMYHPGHLLRIRVRKLGEDKDPQLIHITGVYVRRDDVHRAPLYPSPFVAGNFIFAYHTMFDEVPIDPHFHFYGDETSFAARLWTHGYDVFQPDGVVLYHYWVREQHLPLQHYRRTDTRRSQLAYARGRALLGMERIDSAEALKDIELYGLGDKRELDAFWKFAGIDWKKNEVTQQAQEGWWNMEERDKGSSREDIWQTVKEKDTAPAAKKVAPKKPAARKAATKKKVAKKTAKQSELPTIFVQIASYRDPECQWTVKDLFAKAKCPERIHVGICWQFIKDEDKKCFVEPYPYPDQVRVLEFDARESKGVCWARYELQKLYKGEDFSLQIDSHMRFEQDWDETLVQLWDDCKNDHAILTCYPPGYTPPDTLYRDFIHGMGAQRFDDNGILLMKGRPAYKMDKLPEKPMPGAFASGCMLFGPGRMVKEVPYDPHLYFFGEEITLAVRLWTHGFDLFHPNKPVVYHNWKRDKRPTHFSDHENWPQINKRSFARVRHLLGMETSSDAEVIKDIRKYGLGKKRSLKEYEEFSGVDFAARTFSHRARDGVYGEEKKEIADKKINLAIKNKGGGEPKIFVQIASYRDRECQYTIQDLFEKAKNPDRLNVGVCWQYDPDEDADCFQVITRPEQVQMLPYDWREGEGVCWARNQTQQLWNGEEYTLQIDSHMRFVSGWDDLMIAELAACPSAKPLLSCSPASYTPPNSLQANPKPTIRRVMPFFPDGNLRGRGEYIDRSPDVPLNGAFLAAGFMFSHADVIHEVPYDPYMYFDQEEISYAARLYTHGWDIFSSRKPLLYHYYNSDKGSVRPLHWQDLGKQDNARITYLRKRGMDRFNHLVGHTWSEDRDIIKDLVFYGFGVQRSLKDYEDYAGIDFRKKIASERALRCQFIKDLDKYRDLPIHVPELDGEQPASKPKRALPKMNDNKQPEPQEKESTEEALRTLDPTIRLHKEYPGKRPPLGIGDYAPLFRLQDDQDNKRALEVMSGKPVMLLFFPSNNKEFALRLFKAMDYQMKSHGKLDAWQVFISDTTVEELPKFKKDVFVNAPFWADPDRAVSNAFGVADLKNNRISAAGFLLGRNLKIIGRHVNLGAEQLAAAMVNDCVHAIASDKKKYQNPLVITENAPALIIPDALSPEFCDHCIHIFRNGHTFEGTVGAEERTALRKDAKVRRDYVVHGKLLDELDDKLSRSLFPEIRKVFGFDVTYRELYKIGLYSGDNQGFFKQHRDNFDAPLGYRRIAMTLHLSDDFEGGGLKFPEYGDHIYRPNKGAAIAFSSATTHEALPVTRGERFVIVGFFHGDQDEAYRRQYLTARKSPLKIHDYAPMLRSYDKVKLSRDFYDSWQAHNVSFGAGMEHARAVKEADKRTVMINTKSGHQPKRIFESGQAIIMDDFLPQAAYEKLLEHALKTDYEYLNTNGKVSRAWHVHDGFPMRSKNNVFYYTKDHPKPPKGAYVYPTGRALDPLIDALRGVEPHVKALVGEEAKDWWHVSASCWIYPPTTGLSIHDDGSGVYSGAYVYFLNPTWRPHWGGMLTLMDEETNELAYALRNSGDQRDFYKLKYFHANNLDEEMMKRGLARSIFPKGNRIVFIASDVYHMITRVNEAAGDNLRMSVAGFYNRKKE